MTFAIIAALIVIALNLFAFALCRVAHDADEAMGRLYAEAGTEMFDR